VQSASANRSEVNQSRESNKRSVFNSDDKRKSFYNLLKT